LDALTGLDEHKTQHLGPVDNTVVIYLFWNGEDLPLGTLANRIAKTADRRGYARLFHVSARRRAGGTRGGCSRLSEMDGFSRIALDRLPETFASLVLSDRIVSIALCPKGYMLPYVNANPIVTLSFYDRQHGGSLAILTEAAADNRDKIRRSGMEPFATPLVGIAFREARILLECEKLHADWIKG
jgi:hypothetical protein